VCLLFNALSTKISKYTPVEITDQWNLRISPSGYAFSIWGIIYTLLLVFTVYQGLPQEWVPARNNELIFDQIGYVFAANCILNASWLMIFQTGTMTGFIVSLIDMLALLVTCLFIMTRCTRYNVNTMEAISMRIGFSLYAGWVTSATLLNVSYVLASLGVREPKYNEEKWTVVILWIAFAIYNVASFSERNPLYGAVYIWTILAIRNNVLKTKPELEDLEKNTS
jgi:hypothetical protein